METKELANDIDINNMACMVYLYSTDYDNITPRSDRNGSIFDIEKYERII